MKARFCYLPIILFFMSGHVVAQVPVIKKIERQISFPKSRLLITGSGFSTNLSNLQVWFDQVQGTILVSTDFSIEVEVPAQARFENVTVVNLVSKLSSQSLQKYMPVFSGGGFDPTKLVAEDLESSPDAVFDIIATDIDGDNKPDLIGSRNQTTSNSMALLMNQSTIGNISFTNTVLAALNVNAPTGHLATGDLNGDGKPDLVASRDGSTSNTVFVLRNTSTIGNPDFAPPLVLILDIIQGAREVGIADLNGDGKPEIIVANYLNNILYIFKNESIGSTLSINPTPIKIAVTGATETRAMELQDMDGDGKTDIVVTSDQKADFYLLKNTSTLSSITFSNITRIALAGSLCDLATADLNRDGKLDVIMTSLFSAQAKVLLNKSSTTGFTFDAPITLTTDSQPFGIDVSDINGDGFPDFIIPCRGTGILNIFLHNGNISAVGFTKVNIATTKTNWYVRAGDLDGDAKPDIAFTSFSGTTGPYSVDILRNKNCHEPKILNTPPLFLCPAQTIRLNAIPIPGVTFDWNNGFGSIKNSADPFVDVTVASTYTVTANSEGGACSVTSAPIIIQSGAGTLPADPVITTNAPVCTGSVLTLSTAIVSGATYSWTGPDNFTSNLSTISIPNASSSNAGIYSLTVKVGDCSSNTVTKRIDVVTFGGFSISSSSASNTICQGQSLTLSVNSVTGYSYQWLKDGGAISGQTAPSLTVNQEGTYKVKVTNTALGCSDETSEVPVVVFASPSAAFTLDATGCVGSTITFNNSSVTDVKATSVIYLWEFGDAITSPLKDPTHIYNTAQSFSPKLTVSYSGVTGCTSTVTKSIDITTGTPPVISATKSELCANETETSTLSVSGTFSSFAWSTNESTSSIDVTLPGDYSVETVAPNGCDGTATITITEKTDCTPLNTEIPVVFTPNGDSQNDFWIIPGIENKGECTMNIFDGRGRRILEKKGFPVEGWDGISDEGKAVPDGTYFYVLSCPALTPETGSVLIVR